MVRWELTTEKSGKSRKFWGTSDAASEEAVMADYSELWRKLFLEQLTWYPRTVWNSLLCGMTVDRGSTVIELARDLDLMQMRQGCALNFAPLQDYLEGDFESDEAFEQACRHEEAKHIRLLQQAWAAVRDEPGIRAILADRPIPFRVIDEPDDDVVPLVDTILK